MERVLLNKISYLVQKLNWEILVVTTDQNHRHPFYPFPKEVKMIDLDINYSVDNNKNVFKKIAGYLKKKRKHKKALTDLLMRENADITVSLYPSESSFLCDIKDGSKKVLELHFSKFFRIQYARHSLLGLIDRFRTKQDEQIVKKFDKFVILSEEDHKNWGEIPNIDVIPNAALSFGNIPSDVSQKRVIAVGRLDYQKGFDRLIDAWNIVVLDERFKTWRLDIFGQGEWQDKLQQMIDEYGIGNSIQINTPTTNIGDEYAKSSLLAMTSNYEGFPMVMIEAMSCGIPVVSFDFPCGPKDIIENGVNGLLVNNGDILGLAKAMMKLMEDDLLRKNCSENAKKVLETYSEQSIMEKWVHLFTSLERK